MYRFEKLRVFHNAMDLVEEIYRLTKKLPEDEKFALANQLKGSSTSIVLYIAEGTGSLGDVEFKNFLRHALKSPYETIAGLKLAEKLFNVKITISLSKYDTIGKELHALVNSLTNDKPRLKKSNDQSPTTND